MSIGAIHLSALAPVAEDIGGGFAKAIPILGTALNVVSTGRDAYLTYDDYEKCLSGN